MADMATKLRAALLCAALLATAATPAHAAEGDTVYYLTVEPVDFARTVRAATTEWATLTCAPVGGTHPRVRDACRQLNKVNGYIERIPPASRACTLEYDPVELNAHGLWKGQWRTFTSQYGNRCEAELYTGAIFDF